MIITVIEHDLRCPLDRFAAWLTEPDGVGRVTFRVVRAWAGDLVPRNAAQVGDALVVLGGPGDAYDDAGAPWLPPTRELLVSTVAAGLPTLGLCLGAQLLAVATGGRVQVAAPPGREAGVVDVHLRPAAAHDPLLSGLAAPGAPPLAMPTVHADAVVDLPAGAVWLAFSRLYPYQAFRVGTAAWGLQFHPEVSEPTFAAWAERFDDVDPATLTAAFAERRSEVAAGGRAIAHAFARVVGERLRDPAREPPLVLSR